ncbi:MAG: DnaD domain protein [Intestinibaculum porci]|uniref:DnaD domain protein n=1 Tax=Intestinibaculum porci TaxID=2487118 RepID=UPI003F0F47D6
MNYDLFDYNCIDFRKLLLLKGKSLHLSDQATHLLMIMMTLEELNMTPITPQRIGEYSSLEAQEIDAIMLDLINSHYVDRINGVLDFSPVKRKLLHEKVEEKKEINLVSLFENTFGRALSATEVCFINDFKRSGYDDEMIVDALKEAAKSNVLNFRYVERILQNWAKYGKKKRREENEETSQFSDEVKNYHWW